MNTAKKNTDPATIGDVLVAVDTLGRAVDRRLSGLEQGQTELKQGQAVLMENQVDLKRGVDAILAHLGIAAR